MNMRRAGFKRSIDLVCGSAYALVVVFAILFLTTPILLVIVMSFDGREFLGRFPPPFLSLQYYESLFSSSLYMGALQNTAIIAVLSTIVAVFIGVITAYALVRYEFKGKASLEAFFMSPLIVPGVILGFSLLLFFSAAGLIEGYGRIVMAHALVSLPYTIRVAQTSIMGISRTLTEAAMSLGATERQAFFSITLPMARAGVLSGGVLALAHSIDEVNLTIFLVDSRTMTLPIALLVNMRQQFDLTIAAASGIMILFVLILIAIVDSIAGLDRIIGGGMYDRRK
jgi:putative spermidine/putrescine transport system permease protein